VAGTSTATQVGQRRVGQHHHRAPGAGLEQHQRREAPGTALVQGQLAALQPAQHPVHAEAMGQRLLRAAQLHDQCRRAVAKLRAGVADHVVQRGLDHADAGQVGGDAPRRRRRAVGQVSCCRLGARGPGDVGRAHAQRLEELLAQRGLQVAAQAARDRQRQHHHPEVGVLGLAADGPRQLHLGQRRQQLGFSQPGVRVGRVGRGHAGRQRGQAAGVGEEVAHEDLALALAGHDCAFGQVAGDRVVQ
jgi:hypothetical protein